MDTKPTMTPSILKETEPVVLHMEPILKKIDDHDFFEFCQMNQNWRIELTSRGELIIMPPTSGKTGNRNFNLTTAFGRWVEADGTGIGFDSSTLFVLPNSAKRSPDVAWVKRSRWEALTDEEREEFPPLCPDFVIELRSRSDNLKILQEKMLEYIANGVQLGWLIDPREKKVYIYRSGMDVCCLENPETLSGEPVLPGFVLNVQRLLS